MGVPHSQLPAVSRKECVSWPKEAEPVAVVMPERVEARLHGKGSSGKPDAEANY